MQVEVTDRHLDTARSEAGEAELRNSESLTDWLGAECMNKPVSKWLPQLGCARLSDMTTADLTALAFDAGQRAVVRVQALDLIAARYLEQPAVVAEIEEQAAMRAGEIAEQEAADIREAA